MAVLPGSQRYLELIQERQIRPRNRPSSPYRATYPNGTTLILPLLATNASIFPGEAPKFLKNLPGEETDAFYGSATT